MDIPKTKKNDVVDDCCGIKITDQYRWLEDSDSPEVKNWIESQNQYTDHFLKGENFKSFSDELVKNFKTTSFSEPSLVNGKYFYMERQPDEDQSALYVTHGLEGKVIKLVDPNELDSNKITAIESWSISCSGKYIAYGITKGGNEMSTIYIKDVESNKNISDVIEHVRLPIVKWLPDESGFYYNRNPKPGTVPIGEEQLHTKIYFHRLGDDIGKDVLIFGDNRPKDDMINLVLSLDGKYLAISVANKWTENEIYIYDNKTKKTTPLITKIPAKFSLVFAENKALVKTNYGANNYRILEAPLDNFLKPISEWVELIPEQKNILSSFFLTKDKILVEYLVNACSKVEIFSYEGKRTGEIPLPEYSSLMNISSRREESEFFYGITSLTFPKISFRYDPSDQSFKLYRKTENPINPENYNVTQEWYQSKDGTKIPIFIVFKKGLEKNGTTPTILYGYGGFGNIQEPSFLKTWIPWLSRGGIFAIANIRGGGEFGKNWHDQGIKDKKQNSFDDFISAAEFLISSKYTGSEYLGILGGSNGGLLVSAVAVQKPELFKAVKAGVPLTDMVRFSKFGMAARWIHEYGDPSKLEDLKNILKWSPYHNVSHGINYPDFLFSTAENDVRVHPFHARKMVAMLQDSSVNNKKVYLYTEKDAGHGSGKPIWKIVEGSALTLSFFAENLGLKI